MTGDVQRRKIGVARLSVVSNATLVVLKLVVGIAAGSVSVISEAIHSGVDLMAALIALFAVSASGKPADREHPFGHGKFENISGAAEALLIFVAAAWIVYEAIHKLLHPKPLEAVGWGVGVMLFSALANLVISHKLFAVGNETESIALQADAWHLRTDVYTSAGVTAALAGIWIGDRMLPSLDLLWVDAVAAMVVALLILRAARRLTTQSVRDLLDTRLPVEEEEWIRAHIARPRPQVSGFHNLRTRKSGPTRFVEFHLLVEADMSVEDSHHVTEILAREIEEHLPGSSVTIHIEPCPDPLRGRGRPDAPTSSASGRGD